MSNGNFISMVEHLAQSAPAVQTLVTGFGYILGILFIMIGLRKLKIIADYRARSSSQSPMIVPAAYILGGAALIYIPTAIEIASITFFGTSNILAYQQLNTDNIPGAMVLIIQTAGVIWFVRGTSLLVNASNIGIQHGAKGLTFLIAGILAVNFEGTVAALNTIMQNVSSYTLAFKGNLGY